MDNKSNTTNFSKEKRTWVTPEVIDLDTDNTEGKIGNASEIGTTFGGS